VRLRTSRTLSQRPVADTNISHFINRELLPLLRELLRMLTSAPLNYEWFSGAASLDTGGSEDFVPTGPLTQNSSLTLYGGQDGCAGTIFVQQDAVGGWTLSVTALGRIIVRESPLLTDDPDPAPNVITRYEYRYATISGEPVLLLQRTVLA
jgi:hypothetical protein